MFSIRLCFDSGNWHICRYSHYVSILGSQILLISLERIKCQKYWTMHCTLTLLQKEKLSMIFEKYYLNFSYNAGSNNILCSTIHWLCKNALIVFLKKSIDSSFNFCICKKFQESISFFFLNFYNCHSNLFSDRRKIEYSYKMEWKRLEINIHQHPFVLNLWCFEAFFVGI